MPTVAQSAWWSTRPTGFLDYCRRRYGDTFTVSLTQGGRWVFVSHPDDARTIFTTRPEALVAGATHELLEALFGSRSIHLLDHDEHLRQRKLLLPPLHGSHLTRYARIVEEVTLEQLDSWPTNEERPALPHLRRITLEVIMRGIFGFAGEDEGAIVRRRLDTLLNSSMGDSAVIAATLLPERLFRYASTSRLFAFRRAKEALGIAILAEIRRRRAAESAGEDMLSLLLGQRDEAGEPLADDELKDNLVTLVVAGHETTATALAWSLHLLARHPIALDMVNVGIESGDDESLDRVVRETLRLHPTVPLAMRRLLRPLEFRDGTLPAGTNVAVCIHLLQRCPDAWGDPDEFRPDRFSADHSDHSYAWAPFGGGTRRCLGASLAPLEMRLVLRTLLARRGLRMPLRPPEKVTTLALRPSRGARVTLYRR